MKKRIAKLFSLLVMAATIFTGCSKENSMKRDFRVVPNVFHTDVVLYMYNQKKLNKIYNSFSNYTKELHRLMDRDNSYDGLNNLKTINDSYGTGQAISISDELMEVIKLSIKMGELTDGYFNPAMGTLIDLWEPKFDLYYNTDPSSSEIAEALTCVPTIDELKDILILNEEAKTVTFNAYGGCESAVKLSLGGIGKGYAMDKLKEFYVSKYGDEPAMIDGGSSSLHVIGTSPTLREVNGVSDYYWVIAPSAPRSSYYALSRDDGILFKFALQGDGTVSTSGNEVNYYILMKDGGVQYENNLPVVRTHILNPYTGMSEQHYDDINVASNIDAGVLDALTTALYNISDLSVMKSIITRVEEYFNISIDYSFSKLIKDDNGDYKIIVNMSQSMKDKSYGYHSLISEINVF